MPGERVGTVLVSMPRLPRCSPAAPAAIENLSNIETSDFCFFFFLYGETSKLPNLPCCINTQSFIPEA